MSYKDIGQMTPERWIGNLLEIAAAIADAEQQESRWLALDRYAWEGPSELINVIFDDCVFELFLKQYADTFSSEQREAAYVFRDSLNAFCAATPQELDPAATLTDPRWHLVRRKAAHFVNAFMARWPLVRQAATGG